MRSRFYDRWWFFLDWPLTIMFWTCIVLMSVVAVLFVLFATV